jgi:two-component system response regulator ArlR
MKDKSANNKNSKPKQPSGILIIEDDVRLANSISLAIQTRIEDINCFITTSGERGVQKVFNQEYKLVILDLMLPDCNGLSVINKIKSYNNLLPVIILSGINSTISKVQALDSGADDYLTKPFDYEELIARVKVVLKRFAPSSHNIVLNIGGLSIDLFEDKITYQGKPIRLSSVEYTILRLLASKKGDILSKQDLSAQLSYSAKTIDVFIFKIREKMKAATGKDFIKTEWGKGYSIREEK